MTRPSALSSAARHGSRRTCGPCHTASALAGSTSARARRTPSRRTSRGSSARAGLRLLRRGPRSPGTWSPTAGPGRGTRAIIDGGPSDAECRSSERPNARSGAGGGSDPGGACRSLAHPVDGAGLHIAIAWRTASGCRASQGGDTRPQVGPDDDSAASPRRAMQLSRHARPEWGRSGSGPGRARPDVHRLRAVAAGNRSTTPDPIRVPFPNQHRGRASGTRRAPPTMSSVQ